MKLALPAISALVLLTGCTIFPTYGISETTATDFSFTTNNGTITITKCTSSAATVAVPDSINGLPVTIIDPFAFFVKCRNVAVISIPRSVSKLGNASLTPFCGPNLTTIIVDPNNKYYSSTNGLLFNKNKTTLIQCPGGKSGCVAIPDGVLNIETDSFGGCDKMTHVMIPNSVTNIGYNAFFECTSLVNVTIPDSVINMGNATFGHCTSLIKITFGKSVKDIGCWTFVGCPNLEGIYFHGNAPSPGAYSFDYAPKAIIYYKPGTTGWGKTFGGRPTAIWKETGQDNVRQEK